MFPYTEPTSYHEVTTFMRAHGAGTYTSVPRDKNTWPQQALNRADRDKPARIRYHVTAHMAFGDFFTHNLRPDNLPAGIRTPHKAANPGWYYPVVSDAREFLADDPRGFHPLDERGNAPARLLDKLGDLLRKNGYPRDLTALTIAFYRYNTGNFDSYTVAAQFIDRFLDLAHLAAHPGLTMDEKTDVLARQITRKNLDDLLAGGAPYTLLKDMFPMGQADGWARLTR